MLALVLEAQSLPLHREEDHCRAVLVAVARPQSAEPVGHCQAGVALAQAAEGQSQPPRRQEDHCLEAEELAAEAEARPRQVGVLALVEEGHRQAVGASAQEVAQVVARR